MDVKKRLNELPEEVRRAFSTEFIFLISQEKVQHFPAREWTKEQTLTSLDEHLGSYTFGEWEGQTIAVAENQKLIAIIPRF